MSEAQLAQLLAVWCAPRGIDPGFMLAVGFTLETRSGFGPVAILREYHFSNGERAPDRILLLDPSRHEGREWRWEGGARRKGSGLGAWRPPQG